MSFLNIFCRLRMAKFYYKLLSYKQTKGPLTASPVLMEEKEKLQNLSIVFYNKCLFTLIPMDGSLWMESHLKADGPKCVVLAFLCCPDAYYCPILDIQFSLFFGQWFDWIYVVSCVLAESEGGVLIFECNQEYTNDLQWFTVLCLEKGQYNTPWSISFQGKTKFSMASCCV